MSAEFAVEVFDLVKRYGNSPQNAVDGVSFTVRTGEVFGLLGPNGAGKTTTIGVLTTRVRPTSGAARVCGIDVTANPVLARSRLAVVPQRNNLDRSLSIRDNLTFHAAYHGVPAKAASARADELLGQFGLAERAGSKPDFFSGGQAQRVMIARALMHAPQVLFLDEPTTGLDPAARLFVWDRLRELQEQGVTLMLTTHDMDEAAELADRVGIMDHGRLLAMETPQALIRGLPGRTTLELSTDGDGSDDLLDALRRLAGVERVEPIQAADSKLPAFAGGPAAEMSGSSHDNGVAGGFRVRLYLSGDAAMMVAPTAAVLAERGLGLSDVKLGTPTLEDVFIHLTGRTLR